jgi:hypothetical protein
MKKSIFYLAAILVMAFLFSFCSTQESSELTKNERDSIRAESLMRTIQEEIRKETNKETHYYRISSTPTSRLISKDKAAYFSPTVKISEYVNYNGLMEWKPIYVIVLGSKQVTYATKYHSEPITTNEFFNCEPVFFEKNKEYRIDLEYFDSHNPKLTFTMGNYYGINMNNSKPDLFGLTYGQKEYRGTPYYLFKTTIMTEAMENQLIRGDEPMNYLRMYIMDDKAPKDLSNRQGAFLALTIYVEGEKVIPQKFNDNKLIISSKAPAQDSSL